MQLRALVKCCRLFCSIYAFISLSLLSGCGPTPPQAQPPQTYKVDQLHVIEPEVSTLNREAQVFQSVTKGEIPPPPAQRPQNSRVSKPVDLEFIVDPLPPPLIDLEPKGQTPTSRFVDDVKTFEVTQRNKWIDSVTIEVSWKQESREHSAEFTLFLKSKTNLYTTDSDEIKILEFSTLGYDKSEFRIKLKRQSDQSELTFLLSLREEYLYNTEDLGDDVPQLVRDAIKYHFPVERLRMVSGQKTFESLIIVPPRVESRDKDPESLENALDALENNDETNQDSRPNSDESTDVFQDTAAKDQPIQQSPSASKSPKNSRSPQIKDTEPAKDPQGIQSNETPLVEQLDAEELQTNGSKAETSALDNSRQQNSSPKEASGLNDKKNPDSNSLIGTDNGAEKKSEPTKTDPPETRSAELANESQKSEKERGSQDQVESTKNSDRDVSPAQLEDLNYEPAPSQIIVIPLNEAKKSNDPALDNTTPAPGDSEQSAPSEQSNNKQISKKSLSRKVRSTTNPIEAFKLNLPEKFFNSETYPMKSNLLMSHFQLQPASQLAPGKASELITVVAETFISQGVTVFRNSCNIFVRTVLTIVGYTLQKEYLANEFNLTFQEDPLLKVWDYRDYYMNKNSKPGVVDLEETLDSLSPEKSVITLWRKQVGKRHGHTGFLLKGRDGKIYLLSSSIDSHGPRKSLLKSMSVLLSSHFRPKLEIYSEPTVIE